MNPVLTSSETHTWQTPESFLALVRAVAPIALDPCTTELNPTGADVYFHQPRWDGLSESWSNAYNAPASDGLVFVNPPYGRELPKWVDKCVLEARQGAEIILLVPSRTDTKWFTTAYQSATSTLLWRGRITFLNADPLAPSKHQMWSAKRDQWVPVAPAAFPSAVFYWGPRERSFRNAFAGKGLFI